MTVKSYPRNFLAQGQLGHDAEPRGSEASMVEPVMAMATRVPPPTYNLVAQSKWL